MRLAIGNAFAITDIGPQDRDAYLEHLAEKGIYDHTLRIPYPYTGADADWWIRHVAEEAERQGRSVNWAIRRSDGYLIGGIGYLDLEIGRSHGAELGYWLAKPYWGRGIMTAAVERLSEYSFSELGLVRISALVFHFNGASARVLEKAGFHCEGRLRNYFKKDGVVFDGLLFAKVREGGGGAHPRTGPTP